MKNLLKILVLLIVVACNNDSKTNSSNSSDAGATEFPVDRDDPKLANVDQAEQMMNNIQAKRTVINQILTAEIKSGGTPQNVLDLGKPMEKIRPMIDRYATIVGDMKEGKSVSFLSQNDLDKLKYRGLSEAEALIDSLTYINSLLDQVLDKANTVEHQ